MEWERLVKGSAPNDSPDHASPTSAQEMFCLLFYAPQLFWSLPSHCLSRLANRCGKVTASCRAYPAWTSAGLKNSSIFICGMMVHLSVFHSHSFITDAQSRQVESYRSSTMGRNITCDHGPISSCLMSMNLEPMSKVDHKIPWSSDRDLQRFDHLSRCLRGCLNASTTQAPSGTS